MSTGSSGSGDAVILVEPSGRLSSAAHRARLMNAWQLREDLLSHWATTPLEMSEAPHGPVMTLSNPGGQPLDQVLGSPVGVADFLTIARAFAAACREMHARGIVHKNLRPSNVLFDAAGPKAFLTGFCIASRLKRQRQEYAPPALLEGTLAYMAPEQTGRMNRSIDTRSDLYAVGAILYEMLVGRPPFPSTDPMELVHCHVARQPVPPHEVDACIPRSVSDIVSKLLAKGMEDRYQTAAGLLADLDRVLDATLDGSDAAGFELGSLDVSDGLMIPERLYGRDADVAVLLEAFRSVASHRRFEFALVSGYSGVGKSSVVQEMQKALVASRGLFASGKFDQHRRDIPFATLFQAVRTLIQTVLVAEPDEHDRLSRALVAALGVNGRLLVDLVPEIGAVVGELPAPAQLSANEAQAVLQGMLRRLIAVFARPEHPLTLFLDDLQWIDPATLDFLRSLAEDPDVSSLLLIGAYRDNEVDATHPLRAAVGEMRLAGISIREIVLSPLGLPDVEALISDALRTTPERSASLSRLVAEKTGGNPFFTIQFLEELVEDGLVAVGPRGSDWHWDEAAIRDRNYSDNVVELIVGKLFRLPLRSRAVLRDLASLGRSAAPATLALITGRSEADVVADLAEPLRQGFVAARDGECAFVHDRIQEAAYALLPSSERPAAHLHIARSMMADRTEPEIADGIFDVVDQYNRAIPALSDDVERALVARLNLNAGRRALSSSAGESALGYFAAGGALLGEAGWLHEPRLTFDLELHRAECEILTGRIDCASARIATLAIHADGLSDRSAIARMRMTIHTIGSRFDLAIEEGLDFLRLVGIDWSRDPSEAAIRAECDRLLANVAGRGVEDLLDHPLMPGTSSWAPAVEVFTDLIAPVMFLDERLLELLVTAMANIGLEHGYSAGTPMSLCLAHLALGFRFGDYRSGFDLARLGRRLLDQPGLERFRARTIVALGCIAQPWMDHISTSAALHRKGIELAHGNGDVTYAVFNTIELISSRLASGEALDVMESDTSDAVAFARKTLFQGPEGALLRELRIIRSFRGTGSDMTRVTVDEDVRATFGWSLGEHPGLVVCEALYFIRRMWACYVAQEIAGGLEAMVHAQSNLHTVSKHFELADFHFFAALLRLSAALSTEGAAAADHVLAAKVHADLIATWRTNCPSNFDHRDALLRAEFARASGSRHVAAEAYEEAIGHAVANRFVHHEALIHSCAARFHAADGLETVARAYWTASHAAYSRWGAAGVAARMELEHPFILDGRPGADDAGSVDRIDFQAVLEASQAMAAEIDIDRLVDTLMLVVMENAGASRGVLLMQREDRLEVAAEAMATSHGVEVLRQRDVAIEAALPTSVVNYVVRTRETVLISHARESTVFSGDPYLERTACRSVMCLPLLKQGRLVAVLYLENRSNSHVFTRARETLLGLLAAQAAASLDNARLYAELIQENEGRRRLEAELRASEAFLAEGQRISQTGTWRWLPSDGRIEGSEEMYRIFGVDPTSGFTFERYLSAIHLEDRARIETLIAQNVADRRSAAFEYRIVLPDGETRHIRTTALLDRQFPEELAYTGTAMDITDRKIGEEALREAQLGLERASRLSALGELAGSIVHEINQPLGAIITNAETCLRWLDRDVPDIERATQTITRLRNNGRRAADVVAGLRALAQRSGLSTRWVDVSDMILEVRSIMHGEIERSGVRLGLDLAPDLGIQADPVQLQQVLANLIRNGIDAIRGADVAAGRLSLTTSVADGFVVFTVEDNGPGLDEDTARRMFEPLFTTKSQGMGMGLAICRTIVEAHEGRLWARPGDNGGAVVVFTIPRSRDRTFADVAPPVSAFVPSPTHLQTT